MSVAHIRREFELTLAFCRWRFRDVGIDMKATQRASKELRRDSYTFWEGAVISVVEERIIGLEAAQARQVCDQALAKWGQNLRTLQPQCARLEG